MDTLSKLQRIADGEFHLLGDELLRKFDARYRRLRTHGANVHGESIKGQPDSYVGDTAATASIAVCYTVQRSGWWNKVVDDVREAISACPLATEVVVLIPRNVDREGPKDKRIDWLANAREAAGEAIVRVIDGREISQLLDTDHQVLRHKFLEIPFSRLSGDSIVAACRFASLASIDAIKMNGRFDPARYSSRSADQELYQLWQTAFCRGNQSDRRAAPVRLIALVNDSGVGKTSLVCEFTRTLGEVQPVLLLQARDLMFLTQESLVSSVIHAIQGFLDPSARVIEEAALPKLLAGSMPLTVVVDGLDEARNPEGIRSAINYWLRSKLCQVAILVVTSRREFWRTCVDSTWVRWLPNANSDEHLPLNVAEHSAMEEKDAAAGVRLPGPFSEGELEAAWLQSGRPRSEFYTLPTEARKELRHPFTLRVFLDLQEAHRPQPVTRVALLDAWLNYRLDVEALPGERITRRHFQAALRFVAHRIAESNNGSVSVDNLVGVPRFDPCHPPGPVVQQLIEASILESVPGQSDRIRFAVEAVQDFYQAEADVEDIKCDYERMAERFAQLKFTCAYPRLERIGYRLVDVDVRHKFISRLFHSDVTKAAIVLRASPSHYTAPTRTKIADALVAQVTDRHRVRAAMAITLLGKLRCPEASEALATHVLPRADLHDDLKSAAATAFTELSFAPAAQFVYRWQRFGVRRGDTYFYKDILASIGAANTEFRTALAEQAVQELHNPSDTDQHVKAVMVLAYLRDSRVVDHLGTRFEANGLLEHYENHALIAVGSDAAASLFARSAIAVGQRLDALPNDPVDHESRHRLIYRVHFPIYDVHYLLAPAFFGPLQRLIEDDNWHVSWIATDLAKRARALSLFLPAAVVAAKERRYGSDGNEPRDCATAEAWLTWWRQAADDRLRRELLGLLPLYPNAQIEEVLVECLESPYLRASAARRLGECGAIRSALCLREILAAGVYAHDGWDKSAAARALGDLRDGAAVRLLEHTATQHSDVSVVRQAIESLGSIGNFEAESALTRLLRQQKGESFDNIVFEALLCCGSSQAVAEVLRRAATVDDSLNWLCERLQQLKWTHGWHQGEYFTHIHTAELVAFIDSRYQPGPSKVTWEFADQFEQIDSPDVRSFLRKWASLRGTPNDPLILEYERRRMSDICFEQLRDRGDESAISYTLDEWASDVRDDFYVAITAERLRSFTASAVAKQLRPRLNGKTTISERLRMLALIGRFGEEADAEMASGFLDHIDDSLANVACEVMLRRNRSRPA